MANFEHSMREAQTPARQPRALTPARTALLLLAATAAFSAWWVQHLTPSPEPAPDLELADAEIRDLEILWVNPDGQPRSRTSSTRLQHYPDGRAVLEEPRLALLGEGGDWRIRAHRALTRDGREQVRLEGDVLLYLEEATEPWHITTAWLLVEPERQRAETSVPVTLYSSGMTHRAGGGLHAALERRRITLHGGVHSVYENPTPP